MRLGIAVLSFLLLLVTTAEARVATGWTKGKQTRINLVHVSGVELEERAARAFREMAKAAKKSGVVLGIRSGFRSHAEQKQLYKEFRRGWGHLAARPGFSNHQNGKALDIYIDDYEVYDWLRHNANRFGFKRTVKREAWHWEYVGGETRQARRAPR